MTKLYKTNKTEAILDMLMAGLEQKTAEEKAERIFCSDNKELLTDCRFYLTGDELITTEDFVGAIEEDYGIKLVPVVLG